MEKTSLKMILHALPQDDMMELEQMIDSEKMKRNDQRYLSQHLGKISITKDGRWTTNCHTGHGAGRKQKKITCRNREELERRIISFYKEAEMQESVTISQVCTEWLNEKLTYKEIGGPTYTRYMTDYNRFLNGTPLGKLPVISLTSQALRQSIKDQIIEHSLSRKAYKQLHILLRGSLRYARENGYTEFAAGAFFADLVLPDRMFSRPQRRVAEKETFSDDEVRLLMDYLWKEQDLRGLGLILMFQTGMRVGELAALRRDNVHDGKIVITGTEEVYTDPATGRKICEVADHAKTEAGERTIILPAQAERTLKAIRVKNPFGEFLFMDKLGRIRGKRFNTWLKRACRKVGIPERSTHKIRKTYASMLLGAGVDEKLVTSQMGHTDISLTKGIYYYNRDSEQVKKQAITHAIDF